MSISEYRIRRAIDTIHSGRQDQPLTEDELYVYAVATLVSDSNGEASNGEVIKAANDPAIRPLAELAVVMMKTLSEESGRGE